MRVGVSDEENRLLARMAEALLAGADARVEADLVGMDFLSQRLHVSL